MVLSSITVTEWVLTSVSLNILLVFITDMGFWHGWKGVQHHNFVSRIGQDSWNTHPDHWTPCTAWIHHLQRRVVGILQSEQPWLWPLHRTSQIFLQEDLRARGESGRKSWSSYQPDWGCMASCQGPFSKNVRHQAATIWGPSCWSDVAIRIQVKTLWGLLRPSATSVPPWQTPSVPLHYTTIPQLACAAWQRWFYTTW